MVSCLSLIKKVFNVNAGKFMVKLELIIALLTDTNILESNLVVYLNIK